ncbi:MAG: hypothetical protein ORO03_03495 [Alphaproteobacteria bacterium]|nr:hypothetical protein [Alphaproteobacteria bacterium]
MKPNERKSWFNHDQKEGLAKIFDAFTIANVLVVFSHLAGRFALSDWETTGKIIMLICTLNFGLYLRKD